MSDLLWQLERTHLELQENNFTETFTIKIIMFKEQNLHQMELHFWTDLKLTFSILLNLNKENLKFRMKDLNLPQWELIANPVK